MSTATDGFEVMSTSLPRGASFPPCIRPIGDAEGRIDPALFEACRKSFRGSTLREIALAASGFKVARLILNPSERVNVDAVARQHGFVVVDGHHEHVVARDEGKGTFSNTARRARPGDSGNVRFTYVSHDASLAEAARVCEESGDSDGFGALLGIPACCRAAYREFEPIARRRQGDLLPLVWEHTTGPPPFDPWINIAVRYFGYCLISFFPCSFRCCAAIGFARRTYDLLSACCAAWADDLLERQFTNVLYTEYQGIHLVQAPFDEGSIVYHRDQIKSSDDTPLSRALRSGNRIEFDAGRTTYIFRDAMKIGTIKGAAYACLFLGRSRASSPQDAEKELP